MCNRAMPSIQKLFATLSAIVVQGVRTARRGHRMVAGLGEGRVRGRKDGDTNGHGRPSGVPDLLLGPPRRAGAVQWEVAIAVAHSGRLGRRGVQEDSQLGGHPSHLVPLYA